jgi:CPA1 family monovalent cation:H+ antiporter
VALRADGTIGDAAFQRLEEELDWTELGWAQVLPPADRPERAS